MRLSLACPRRRVWVTRPPVARPAACIDGVCPHIPADECAMSTAVMEVPNTARSASVGRRLSTLGPAGPVAGSTAQDEIIEDRRRYPDGTTQVRTYLKGRFLGKVRTTFCCLSLASVPRVPCARACCRPPRHPDMPVMVYIDRVTAAAGRALRTAVCPAAR